MAEESRSTRSTRRQYNRIAPVYDFVEGLMERRSFRRWRELLWNRVGGGNVLEVGVGTGKNLPYYPADATMTAIDFSEKMLRRARAKAERDKVNVRLLLMDVENLQFPDNTFDAVAATFVFCSVPHPMRGLQEIARVCKPGGRVILLEHVLSRIPRLARLEHWMGAHMEPDTLFNGRQIIKGREGNRHLVSDPLSGDDDRFRRFG